MKNMFFVSNYAYNLPFTYFPIFSFSICPFSYLHIFTFPYFHIAIFSYFHIFIFPCFRNFQFYHMSCFKVFMFPYFHIFIFSYFHVFVIRGPLERQSGSWSLHGAAPVSIGAAAIRASLPDIVIMQATRPWEAKT
jgi:hypothetical protein